MCLLNTQGIMDLWKITFPTPWPTRMSAIHKNPIVDVKSPMKNHPLFLALGLAVGGTLTAQAQINVNVNGTEYAITEVSGGYQSFYQSLLANPFYSGYYNEIATSPGLAPSGVTTWNGNPISVNNNEALAFEAAYHAAGGDTLAVFAYWLSATPSANGAPSAAEYITSLPQSVYQTPTYGGYSSTEFAIATTVVPEPPNYGWAGTSLLMVFGLAGSANRMNRLS